MCSSVGHSGTHEVAVQSFYFLSLSLLCADVLVSTPLKLVHSLQQGEIKLDAVEWLIVDEADRLFENGYEHQV